MIVPRTVLFLLMFLAARTASAAAMDRQDLFHDETTLRIKLIAAYDKADALQAPLSSADGADEAFGGEVDKSLRASAVLIVPGADGTPIRLGVGLRIRGKDRATACANPPLKLYFKNTDESLQDKTPFRGLKELKIVRLCDRVDHSDDDEIKVGPHAIEQEYLAYKIYQHVTPLSFGVRKAQIAYIDSSRPGTSKILPSFFIEGEKDLSARLESFQPKDSDDLSKVESDPLSIVQVRLFEAMIGNADYTLDSYPYTNAIGLEREKGGKLTAIPYDFDRAASSWSSRFKPPSLGEPTLEGARHQTQTRSVCHSFEIMFPSQLSLTDGSTIIESFLSLSVFAQQLVRADELLSAKEKSSMQSYYEGFAEWLKNSDGSSCSK